MTKISSIFPKNQSPSYKYSVATNITYHFTVNHSCLSTCMESTLKVRFHVIFLVSSSESSTLLWTAAAAKSLQLCPWPHRRQPNRLHLGILQARTLEWVAISFSNAWKWKVKVKSLSHVWLLATPWTAAHQGPPSMGFSRQEYWSRVLSPSPAIYTTWFEFSTKRHSPDTSDIVDILWNSLNIIYSIFRVRPKVEHLEKNIKFDLINTHR